MRESKISLDITLHTFQREIFDCPARFRVVMAGRQSGKSKLAIFEMAYFAMMNKKSDVWYVAPTYSQAKGICWRELVELIPYQLKHKVHESELSIELTNGSMIMLKGSDNENSLRGKPINFVILDETAFMKQHIWEEILRPSLIAKKGKALLIGTPNGKNWFWRLWQEATLGLDSSFAAFKFTTFDNPFLPQEEHEMAKRQTKDIKIYQQEYLAEPQSHEGLVYPEFNREIHVVRPFEIPREARLFRSIDWGIQAPTACLWGAMMPGKEIYIYRTYKKNGLPVSAQASTILGLSGNEKIEANIIDPSTRRRESKSNGMSQYFESVQMQFLRCGIPTILGDNILMEGISLVKDLLVNNQLFIFDTCQDLIMEFITYEWMTAADGDNGFSNERPKDGRDDCIDALRYMACFLTGRSRYSLDSQEKNGTLAEGNVLVTYENGEIKNVRPRKIPHNERQNLSAFDNYGGFY